MSNTNKETIGIGVLNSSVQQIEIQNLPCKINHDGEANVEDYFLTKPLHSTTQETEDGSPKKLQASFRGRLLKGEQLKLPEDVNGVIYKEAVCPEEAQEECDRYWVAESQFNSMMLWGHDALPLESHPMHGALEWSKLAEVIHNPV
mmetsp:Transcript_421/g.555  ORF Transcript_421/g.555 Transcript_421/m.555 type:complete len:146 (+) Transcript_421:64-501(+)